MSKDDRIRIDYMPGGAALEALALAAEMFPTTRQQALLDKLVITAVSALAHSHWRPPFLLGRDRARWQLPAALRPGKDA